MNRVYPLCAVVCEYREGGHIGYILCLTSQLPNSRHNENYHSSSCDNIRTYFYTVFACSFFHVHVIYYVEKCGTHIAQNRRKAILNAWNIRTSTIYRKRIRVCTRLDSELHVWCTTSTTPPSYTSILIYFVCIVQKCETCVAIPNSWHRACFFERKSCVKVHEWKAL